MPPERCAGGPRRRSGRFWHTTTIRDIVLDDCYRPHALDELRAKLAALEEVRETAKTGLEVLDRRREKLDDLEQDKETVMEHHARMAPEALDSLTSEERQRFYAMLRLKVMVEINGDFELSGAFTADPKVCTAETASR